MIFFFVPNVFAAEVEVTGNIGDMNKNNTGSSVVFKDSISQKVVLIKTLDATGHYFVFIPKGKYDISVTAPSGDISQTVGENMQIDSDTDLNKFSGSYLPPLFSWGSRDLYITIGIFAVFIILCLLFFLKKKK